MFEMKIKKIAYFIYLVIFHLKVIVCQPHTYNHHPEKIHLSYNYYQILPMACKQSYGITMVSKYYKFHKD
jgi:hypothetical protein